MDFRVVGQVHDHARLAFKADLTQPLSSWQCDGLVVALAQGRVHLPRAGRLNTSACAGDHRRARLSTEADPEVLAYKAANRKQDNVVANGPLVVEKVPEVWAEVAEHGEFSNRREELIPVVGHEDATVVDHPGHGACTQPLLISIANVKAKVVQLINDGDEEARHAILTLGLNAAPTAPLAQALVQRFEGFVHVFAAWATASQAP